MTNQLIDGKYPVKNCDYCDHVGVVMTFMDGETLCSDCMKRLPMDGRACRRRIVALERELEMSRALREIEND